METFKIKISYSNFATDGENFKEGDQFISVGVEGHNRGSGSPCKTKGEALESLRYSVKEYGITERNLVEYKDETGLIPRGDLFGQNLLAWC